MSAILFNAMSDDFTMPVNEEESRKCEEWRGKVMSDDKDIDLALIKEASKVYPDFQKMEALVKAGADVNAVRDDENTLSEVIVCAYHDDEDEENEGEGDEDAGKELPQNDSLAAVVEFFLKHGFDPSRDEGRAGAKCLVAITWSRCLSSKIPTLKLLLDAGCRNIPAWKDEPNPDEGTALSCIGTEESYLRCCEDDIEGANTYEALYEILKAHDEGRRYSGIDRHFAARGGVLRRICLSKPNAGEPFFDLDEPTSKHENCFRGSLFLEFDKGWLISRVARSLIFDTEPPHEDVIDVSDYFRPIIGATLDCTDFSKKYVSYGTTHYGQSIIRYTFSNQWHLTTQTNFGENRDSETIAYYTLDNKRQCENC